MPVKTSGPLSLSEIAAEFGGTGALSLSQYYRGGARVPNAIANAAIAASGAISIGQFYGASRVTPGELGMWTSPGTYPIWIPANNSITVQVQGGGGAGGGHEFHSSRAPSGGDSVFYGPGAALAGFGGTGGAFRPDPGSGANGVGGSHQGPPGYSGAGGGNGTWTSAPHWGNGCNVPGGLGGVGSLNGITYGRGAISGCTINFDVWWLAGSGGGGGYAVHTYPSLPEGHYWIAVGGGGASQYGVGTGGFVRVVVN